MAGEQNHQSLVKSVEKDSSGILIKNSWNVYIFSSNFTLFILFLIIMANSINFLIIFIFIICHFYLRYKIILILCNISFEVVYSNKYKNIIIKNIN